MPSSLRTPRNLAEWEELDYHKRPRGLRRLWWPAIGVALLASGAAVAWTFLPGHRSAYQAGPVSTAHALFNNDCGQCHTGPFQTLGRLVTFDPGRRSVPDSACTKCHGGSPHHGTPMGEAGCAGCHKEHRGHATLARVSDGQCTSCHADLKQHGGTSDYADDRGHVTAFAPGHHPDFRVWKEGGKDPGHITFSHKAHLDPEGVWDIDQAQLDLQLEKVKELGARAFDIPKKLKRRVKLDCDSCHQTDATGRFMKPINYEQHCRSCHPLSVQLVGDWQGERRLTLARDFSRTAAPHPSSHETPEVVRGVVRDRLDRFITQPDNSKAFLDEPPPEPERLIPGSTAPPRLSRKGFEWVNRQQQQVEHLLFDGAGGCRYCHQEKPGKPTGGLPEFLKSDLPDPWMKHARFNHEKHRMMKCDGCHAGVPASSKAADVLLPRLDACVRCHHGGGDAARSDCVECHTYHDPAEQRKFRGRLGPGLQE